MVGNGSARQVIIGSLAIGHALFRRGGVGGFPAAFGGGEENFFERRLRAVEGADAETGVGGE